MSLPAPNLYVEILIPNVMVFGGGAFGRCLGHGGGALMNGINALIRTDTRGPLYPTLSFSLPLPWEGTARRWLSANQEAGPHQTPALPIYWHFHLGLLSSQNWDK